MIEHKFFKKELNNDLSIVREYLDSKLDDMLSGKLFDINLSAPAVGNPGWDSSSKEPWTRFNGAPTQLGNKYNLLADNVEWTNNLKGALKEMTAEACEYYGIDFDSQDYYATAWFNYDYGIHKYDSKYMHDHSGGNGVPDFHGYYSVDAEPSLTHYHISKDINNAKSNINKNNLAILSETGHPHARGDWDEDRPRITVAYDILPFDSNRGGNFVKL
jgi:hypothetical protein